jgi:hypothetical protein
MPRPSAVLRRFAFALYLFAVLTPWLCLDVVPLGSVAPELPELVVELELAEDDEPRREAERLPDGASHLGGVGR